MMAHRVLMITSIVGRRWHGSQQEARGDSTGHSTPKDGFPLYTNVDSSVRSAARDAAKGEAAAFLA